MNEAELKSCCAAAYESEFARLLLGECFHPGGLALTGRLGELLRLSASDHVLDVASGPGESAVFLASRFGCRVTGVDYGEANVNRAALRAKAAKVDHLVRFELGDAEQLPYPDGSFDVLICECAFCTFSDKRTAAREFFRVLGPGGRIGLSDLTRSGELPAELGGLLAWIACIADARPAAEYAALLELAGFRSTAVEKHGEALSQMVRDVQGRLLGAEVLARVGKLDLPGIDFEEAKMLARHASEAVKSGLLGYSLVTAVRPCG